MEAFVCRYCHEPLRQDNRGIWIDAETHSTCLNGRGRRHDAVPVSNADELERQKRDGVGVFDPRFIAEDDDCREAQDNTPSLGPFKA